MRVRAAPGKLLIRRLKQDEVTKGGLVLTERQELPYGYVIDAGVPLTEAQATIRESIEPEFLHFHTVIFQVVAATKIDILGEETYYMIEYEDVIGVVEDEEKGEAVCK